MIILLFILKYFVVHSLLPVAFVLFSFRLKLQSVNLYQLYIDLLDGQCFFRLCNTKLHYDVIFSRVFACGRSLWVCTYFAGIPSISFHRSRWADFSSVTREIHGMEKEEGQKRRSFRIRFSTRRAVKKEKLFSFAFRSWDPVHLPFACVFRSECVHIRRFFTFSCLLSVRLSGSNGCCLCLQNVVPIIDSFEQ